MGAGDDLAAKAADLRTLLVLFWGGREKRPSSWEENLAKWRVGRQ